MKNSGIEKLWETVYGSTTVTHMMSGHAFARAERAHILTLSALAVIMENEFLDLKIFSDEEMLSMHLQFFSNEIRPESITNSSIINDAKITLQNVMTILKDRNGTSQLWVQYMEMVLLVLQFIRAERSGDWNLHLISVARMLPFFNASGHNLYAKCAHLYYQEMRDLPKRIYKIIFHDSQNRSVLVWNVDGYDD